MEWLNPSQIKSYVASFLTKPKTESETSSSTLHVQLKEILKENVSQDETLSEVIAVLETNYYNFNIENIEEYIIYNLFSFFFKLKLTLNTVQALHSG